MRPAVVQAMYDAIPVAETLLLKKSGHVSMIDEPLEMNSAIADFFDRVESKSQFIPRVFNDASIETGKRRAVDSHLVSIVILLMFGFISGVLVGRRPSSSRGQYSNVP
jgi:hypothetical protein